MDHTKRMIARLTERFSHFTLNSLRHQAYIRKIDWFSHNRESLIEAIVASDAARIGLML